MQETGQTMFGFLIYIRVLMQEPAKWFTPIMYTEQHLVDFGNYILKTYGVQVFSNDGQNVPLYQREVGNADFANWSVGLIADKPEYKLPSQFQIGDIAWFTFDPENEGGLGAKCEILCVHYYPGKVKYDLEIELSDQSHTRMYNIDSDFVVGFIK